MCRGVYTEPGVNRDQSDTGLGLGTVGTVSGNTEKGGKSRRTLVSAANF